MSGVSDADDERLGALYVRARRTAARIVGDDAADDVASEAIVRLLSRWGRVESYAERWVIVVAGNLAVDSLRRRPRPGRAAAPDSFEDELVARLTVRRVLGPLPTRQREVMMLRYLVHLTEAEVAETLGVSVETVRTHLRRGRAAMRRRDDVREALT